MQVNTATQQQTYDASRNPERNDPAPKPLQTPSSHAPETRARARGAQGRSPGQDAAAAPPRASQPAVATPSAPGQPGGYPPDDATTSPGAMNRPRIRRSTANPPAASRAGSSPTFTIFGSNTATPPNSSYSSQQREQLAGDYADRVKTQLTNLESGSEAERNVKFDNARPFTTPQGYFSGGLLAAGFNPDAEINVKFTSGTESPLGGLGGPQSKITSSGERAYKAWQIAAGALEHDRPAPGGSLNWQSTRIAPADQSMVKDLEATGTKLQDHWKQDIAEPLRNAADTLAVRSGKADAYSTQATLQSLQSDKAAFERLSPEGQQAVNRTLGQAGQVIIPNVYGYPLAGHAFVPYTPYDENYAHRPNQGLMIDLNRGSVSEIKGDTDFANWAQRNRDSLVHSFNASDRQGGLDAHWPNAVDVLDKLISGGNAAYPGYRNLVADERIPARELFNYTRSRGDDYRLKYGNLSPGPGDNSGGIASQYQDVNAKNAAWADRTEVFDSSAQTWKSAKEFWNNTFGYVPGVGNAGNIVFGAYDSLNGMTARDRVGGNFAVAISSLQLAHDLAPGAAELTAGKSASTLQPSGSQASSWKHNPETGEFQFQSPQSESSAAKGAGLSPVKGAGESSQPWFRPPTKLDDGRIGYQAGPKRAPQLPGADDNPPPPKQPRTDGSPQPGLSTEDETALNWMATHLPEEDLDRLDKLPEDQFKEEYEKIYIKARQDIETRKADSPQPGPSGVQGQSFQPVLRPPLPLPPGTTKATAEATNALFRPANGQSGVTSRVILNNDGTQTGCMGLGITVTRMAAGRPKELNLLSAANQLQGAYNEGGLRRQKALTAINATQAQESEWPRHKEAGVLSPRDIPDYHRQLGYISTDGPQLGRSLQHGFNPQTNRFGVSPRFAMISFKFADDSNVGHVAFVQRSFENADYLNDRYTLYDSSQGAFSYANFPQLAYALKDYYGAAFPENGGIQRANTFFYNEQQPLPTSPVTID